MRCPHCYGSYSSSFGKGVLAMSPSAFADAMRKANEEKNLEFTFSYRQTQQ